ncbi:MAG: hypothetical protein MI974_06850 [Chitinophagales bacterium]|nr:hypothetical protein [Chitinophagales bacterium]
MKEPKLYFLLKNLSKEEFKRLRKVVLSPIYTTNPKVILLFENIRKQYPNFNNTSAMRAKLYAKVFPSIQYNDQKLRRVFTDLTKVVEQFYVHLELEKQAFKREKILAEAYAHRGMFDLFKQQTNKLLDNLNDHTIKDSDYFFKKMNLTRDLYYHPQYNKYDKNGRILETYIDSLDSYFSLTKMQAVVALKNQMKILKKDYELRFWDVIDQEQLKGFLDSNTAFQLYKLAIQLVESTSQLAFKEYESLLFQNVQFLAKEDKKILFYNGVNYAIRQANKGIKEYSKVSFDWLKFGLESRLLFQNNQLSAVTFGNIVTYGCRAGKLRWVTNFIEEYAYFLREEIRGEEVTYSNVLLNFYNGDYKEVIMKISDYSFSNFYKLKTRNILIRTHFEIFLNDKGDFGILMNALEAFESFLYKNTLFKKERLEPYNNLTQILKGLSTRILRNENAANIKEWLVIQLKERKNISGRQWLKERFQISENDLLEV